MDPMTTSYADDRAALIELIKERAVIHEHVVLSSGLEADYYLDLRRVTLDAEVAPLIGRVMLGLLESAGSLEGVQAAGGLTMGADPVGTAMLHQAAAQGRKIDAFVVRKEAKKHALARRIEGPEVSGRTVVAVEDTSTTGNSVLSAVEALREAGATVAAVAVIVDRDTGARERVEAAGLPYLAAITTEDLGLA
ncbi:orotate phosphoribosyltransferase [Sediminivirga luteola]|uniref:orotate phosphoribosyltransferase n=1 Tax=Sediminivirga luteola TaxID=1774748 RepID=UPI003BB7F4E4